MFDRYTQRSGRCTSHRVAWLQIMTLVACVIVPLVAHGFGPLGHRAAEQLADSLLCVQASAAVERLEGSRSLVGLGAWADRIRNEPRWEHTAPWHYLNVSDEATVTSVASSTSDHVLWAIEHFAAELVDADLAPERRAEALRFIVHFVVDIHQPLHIGRATDRGGNGVSLVVDGRRTNLHRLWDTGVIARGPRSEARLAAALATLSAESQKWVQSEPLDWAEESRALRAFVYSFGRRPTERYLDGARSVLERRLAQAGVRLAATLNGMFCSDPAA